MGRSEKGGLFLWLNTKEWILTEHRQEKRSPEPFRAGAVNLSS
jgi:hypothetical protein